MKIGSLALITRLGVAALVPLAAGCNDDSEDFLGPSMPFVGTWAATSLTVDGENLIANGMILNATFDDSGVYVFHVESDQSGICGEETFCDVTGTWTGTDTQIVLNPGEAQTTISYVTSGETMTLTGPVGGVESTIIFEKFQVE